jgi:hypothetical protein
MLRAAGLPERWSPRRGPPPAPLAGNDHPEAAMSRSLAVLLTLSLLASAAHAAPAQPSGAGKTFNAGTATIWYEVRGSGGERPLVMVNGGPGFDHTYVLCSDA